MRRQNREAEKKGHAENREIQREFQTEKKEFSGNGTI